MYFLFRKEGSIPQLELETSSGALLSDDDPLGLLFPLGAVHAEPVVGKIIKLNLPPLVERYKETCSQMNLGTFLNLVYKHVNPIQNTWFKNNFIALKI